MTKNEKSGAALDKSAVTATAENALAAVRAAGANAEALIASWIQSGNARAVLEVSERGDGPARKAARRGINVLRSRGIAVPALHRVSSFGGAQPDIQEAWMMAPDSSGMQLFAVAAHPPTGRYRSTFVFLHGAQGVARIENATMSQSQLKEYFGKLLPGSGYGAIPVPVEWARFRIADARRVHRERGLPEPLGFTTAATLLEPAPAASPVHPFDDEGFEMSDDDASDLAKGSANLHNVAEFRGWLPSNQAMQEVLTNVGSKLSPGETPDPAFVTDHLRGEADAATDRYFTEEVRADLVRQMKDSALSVLAREGEQRALEVAATMNVIQRCGLVTNPPRDVPFLKAFFDKAVALMIARGGGRLKIPVTGTALASAGAPPETADAPPPPA